MSAEQTTKEAENLILVARKQLDEHIAWLVAEIEKLPVRVNLAAGKTMIVHQAYNIKLRVVRAHNGVASVIYDYPDELFAFLRSDAAPEHLRKSLEGGHVLDQNTPSFKAERVQ